VAERGARKAVVARAVTRVYEHGGGSSALDAVAVEAPLEIRVAGETLAITMRTPGEDHELALGLLLSEGVIGGGDDIGRAFHCGRPGEAGYGDTIDLVPGPGVALSLERIERARRGTLMTAACGVCGRRSIDDLLARCAPLPAGARLPLALLRSSAELLSANQRNFAQTGGLHAAAVITAGGELLVSREDVGRHNAVDKAIGALLITGALPVAQAHDHEPASGAPALLVVSGRVSFEIVQKAISARISTVCGISAPTSLAIDLAESAGVTLAGFVRQASLNVYTHLARIIDV
jgi:FdhD protein